MMNSGSNVTSYKESVLMIYCTSVGKNKYET